jgi:hypothetical protein
MQTHRTLSCLQAGLCREIATTPRTIEQDPTTSGLTRILQEREDGFSLADVILHHNFPSYRYLDPLFRMVRGPATTSRLQADPHQEPKLRNLAKRRLLQRPPREGAAPPSVHAAKVP